MLRLENSRNKVKEALLEARNANRRKRLVLREIYGQTPTHSNSTDMIEVNWCVVTLLVLLIVTATVSLVLTTCCLMMYHRKHKQPYAALYPSSNDTQSQEVNSSYPINSNISHNNTIDTSAMEGCCVAAHCVGLDHQNSRLHS